MVIKEGVFLLTPDMDLSHVKLTFQSPQNMGCVMDSVLSATLVQDVDPQNPAAPTQRLLFSDLLVHQSRDLRETTLTDRLGRMEKYFIQSRKTLQVDGDGVRIRSKLHLSGSVENVKKLTRSILPSLPHRFRHVMLRHQQTGATLCCQPSDLSDLK
jgi:hypothetical protein